MSTRCVINFCDSDGTHVAKVYRHCDGYPGPNGVDGDMQKFFEAVQAETQDTRFDHAEYLAAKFIVWQAEQNRKYTSGKPLDFLSVGIITRDPGDIEYIWTVTCCADQDKSALPTVTYKEALE